MSCAPLSSHQQPSHFTPQTQRCIQAQRNGSAATKKDSSRSLLPTDRNAHWLQIGMVWDNSGTNWQLQLCLSFVFCPFTPLCWSAFEDCQSLHEKRKFLSYSVFSDCYLLGLAQLRRLFCLFVFSVEIWFENKSLIFGMTTSQQLIWHRGQDLSGSLKCLRRLFVMILSSIYCVILLGKHMF